MAGHMRQLRDIYDFVHRAEVSAAFHAFSLDALLSLALLSLAFPGLGPRGIGFGIARHGVDYSVILPIETKCDWNHD